MSSTTGPNLNLGKAGTITAPGSPGALTFSPVGLGYSATRPTINVSSTGNDTTGDGTVAKPFLTINAAINAGTKLWPNSPDLYISVGSGTFTESLNITGQRISITGNGPANTTLAISSGCTFTNGGYIQISSLSITRTSGTSYFLVDTDTVMRLSNVTFVYNGFATSVYINATNQSRVRCDSACVFPVGPNSGLSASGSGRISTVTAPACVTSPVFNTPPTPGGTYIGVNT